MLLQILQCGHFWWDMFHAYLIPLHSMCHTVDKLGSFLTTSSATTGDIIHAVALHYLQYNETEHTKARFFHLQLN